MAFNRRLFLAAGAVALASVGCNRVGSTVTRPADDADVSAGWLMMKTYLMGDGRIVDTGNGSISHSEGQGYGMLLAALAGDRDSFDKMYRWTMNTLRQNDKALFAWRYDPSSANPISDPNNATDGDILIAWALMIAGDRWKESTYRKDAASIRKAVQSSMIVKRGGMSVILPGQYGFQQNAVTTVNLSYYIWPALDAFRKADGDAAWGDVLRDGEALLAKAQFGPLHLPTDWIDLSDEGAVVPTPGRPPRFGFDAVRIPLYLMMGGRGRLAAPIESFWSSYINQGRAIPAWVDVQNGQTASFPLSSGAMTIVARLTGRNILAMENSGSADYYSTVLKALSQIPSFS
ncbi:endoglucanase [Altericroceibacterium spongiae]|uniref:Glucanase n=1 Tax=Altericroceibacterium spongiae TaxID=2320269 RepID=A0A420EQY4_9SPHN|nr:glycosyl hydrolase family 8 [Altericroceibacterium spongiae]RKF23106.1 endoglucanase [Altericroceibacterium spongiae]